MLINNNVATLEFEGTGPTSTNTVTAFTCRLDRNVNGNFMEVTGSEEQCMALPGMLLQLELLAYSSLLSVSCFSVQGLAVLHTQSLYQGLVITVYL